MSVQLEVHLSDESAALVVSGSDPVLGAWDVSNGVSLEAANELRTIWRGEIPLPEKGSEFKLAVMPSGGGEATWEELPDNRRFPTTCEDGVLLKMEFGNPRIGIEVSAEQHERNAKATRKSVERQGSALQDNIDKKGDNAYYHAHNRDFEVPEHAKVITGPGIITGGAPVLLEAGAAVAPQEEERTVWLKDYSWSDSTGKVKVYVPVPAGLLPVNGADSIVEASYSSHQVDLIIECKPRQRLKIEKLNAEVNVDACTTRVEAAKNRIVLQLAKKRETTWYNLTK